MWLQPREHGRVVDAELGPHRLWRRAGICSPSMSPGTAVTRGETRSSLYLENLPLAAEQRRKELLQGKMVT